MFNKISGSGIDTLIDTEVEAWEKRLKQSEY